jgi:HAD superfamily phosphoserine phosphatase-like hydrolase
MTNFHLYFDVDRTLRNGSAALDFCNFLLEEALIDSSFQEKDAKIRRKYKAGEIDYQEMVELVVRIHGATLKGIKTSDIEPLHAKYIQRKQNFFNFTEPLFEKLSNYPVTTTLVSAGIRPAIAAVGEHLGVDTVLSSTLKVVDDEYTGEVTRVLHDQDKRELVSETASENHGMNIGFGDSTGDLGMLELMDKVFIIEPHQEEMVKLAEARGWPILKKDEDIAGLVEEFLTK